MEKETVIIYLSIILILANFLIISIVMFVNKRTSESTSKCPVGQCAVNRVTGEKRCPQDDSELNIDRVEDCTNKFSCDSESVPYAVKSDGSTDLTGACDPGVPCRCTRTPLCAGYIRSIFQNEANHIIQSVSNPPMIISDVMNSYCTLNPQLITSSFPGCDYGDSLNDFIQCMDKARGCIQGFTGNACLDGELAFITDFPDKIDPKSTIIGCVAMESCPCGQLNVWLPTAGISKCITQNSTKPEIIANQNEGNRFARNNEYGNINNILQLYHPDLTYRKINKLRILLGNH